MFHVHATVMLSSLFQSIYQSAEGPGFDFRSLMRLDRPEQNHSSVFIRITNKRDEPTKRGCDAISQVERSLMQMRQTKAAKVHLPDRRRIPVLQTGTVKIAPPRLR